MGSSTNFSRDNSKRRCFALQLECLESREVLYGVSGNLWPHPELVTISFMPDGSNLGGPSSDLITKFNTNFGSSSAWQNVILKAAQSWAQQTNLNFSVIADNGMDSGGGAYQQGDSGAGDIRIGGFNFSNSSLLALAYMPPSVNNYSIAGDIGINTGQIFNINGGDYDLYTVMLHELGHTLGLDHSTSPAAVLYSSYQGIENGLNSDDIAGIRAIYGGARSPDAFDAAASNSSFATANDVSSNIDPTTLVAQVPNLDITTTSDLDYYKFTVPAGGTGSLNLTVQSRGLSLLAPSLRVYNGSQTQVAVATGTGYLGSTLTVNLNVTAGQTYYIRVGAANSTAFGTGAYGISMKFGGTAPTIPSPDTHTLNDTPTNGGGGVANRTDKNGLSVKSLLIDTDRLVNRLLGNGWLSNLVNRLIQSAIELPFVDGLAASQDPTSALPLPVLHSLAPTTSLVVTADAGSRPNLLQVASLPNANASAGSTSTQTVTVSTSAWRTLETREEVIVTPGASQTENANIPTVAPARATPGRVVPQDAIHAVPRQDAGDDAYFAELAQPLAASETPADSSRLSFAAVALVLGMAAQPRTQGKSRTFTTRK